MLAIIMKGLPWSGKSTRAEEQEWFIIISKDKIRKAYPELNEEDVHKLQTKLIEDAKTDIIVDNTHMNKWTLQSTIDLCKKLWYDVHVKDMYEHLFADEWALSSNQTMREYLYHCRKYNKIRENVVPDSVIYNMYLKNYPIWWNYFIFDIDGTLAKMHPERREALERKDYKAFYSNLVLKDEPIKQTINMIECLVEWEYRDRPQIVLMSWRSNECCSDTIKRLSDNWVQYDYLLMRQAWNHNQDSYVKSRLFDECLWRQDAKCLWVFDDREQVMKMWRDKWLFVFDVSQGNRDF